MDSGFYRSPSASSTSCPSICLALAGSRTNARTGSPMAASSRTTLEPTFPVAPVTSTLPMWRSPLPLSSTASSDHHPDPTPGLYSIVDYLHTPKGTKVSTDGVTGLTTTSYAILGMLAIKPWSPYEIATQWDRSLGRLWPRARSKLYEEPKKLVAGGLARASEGTVGRRHRTVYAITAKGRRALRAWLAEPGAGPVLEYEQLLKVFFGEHGSKRAILVQLAAAKRWADDQRAIHAAVARAYLSGKGPFP